jgi:hypothetical protein
VVGRAAHHRLPGGGGAGEGDLGHLGVADQDRPGALAQAGHDVDDPFREAGLLDLQGGGGRDLRRLDHHGVAGRQRRAQLPQQQQDRRVPGGDGADHAERLAQGVVQHVRHGHRDGLALDGLGQAGEVVAPGAERPRLAEHLADHLAVVEHLVHRQPLDRLLALQQVAEAAQQPGPPVGGSA